MPTAELTAARLRRPGPDGAHILLIAGRTWLAEARSPDEQRLPVRVLDRLWLTTRRGIELDVVCGVDRILRMLESFAASWNLARYDAVVLLPDPGGWPMSARTQRVIDRVAAVTRVIGVSDSVLRPGATTDPDGTMGWNEIQIGPSPDECPTAAAVHAIEGALAGMLRTGERPAARPRPASVAEHLQRIAVLASTTFAVGSSAIAVLGAEGSRTLAAVGAALTGPGWVRTSAVEPQLVLDAWRDSRFSRRPRAAAADAVRFFAAHPLQRSDGTSIGALSVFDTEPRSEDEFDGDVLRELAMLASAEIQYAGASA